MHYSSELGFSVLQCRKFGIQCRINAIVTASLLVNGHHNCRIVAEYFFRSQLVEAGLAAELHFLQTLQYLSALLPMIIIINSFYLTVNFILAVSIS